MRGVESEMSSIAENEEVKVVVGREYVDEGYQSVFEVVRGVLKVVKVERDVTIEMINYETEERGNKCADLV